MRRRRPPHPKKRSKNPVSTTPHDEIDAVILETLGELAQRAEEPEQETILIHNVPRPDRSKQTRKDKP